jgi:hypothetical protein
LSKVTYKQLAIFTAFCDDAFQLLVSFCFLLLEHGR